MAIPAKLKKGDGVRIISPARSLALISESVRQLGVERLEELGLVVSFGANALIKDEDISSSIEQRVEDLHAAFKDPSIKAILTSIGGFNSNQLLPHIDYELIRNNPKILCGYSDITALANAIYAKAELVTYSGPHFSTFGQKYHLDYTISYFEKCLMNEEPFLVEPSEAWSDDAWYRDQENRTLVPNDGYWIINEGEATGKILGGNLCTLNLLQGTQYLPALEGSVLFIEDDSTVNLATFDRDLVSLIQQPGFSQVKGIVIGRFQRDSEVSRDDVERLCRSKRELTDIPIIANVDFGHTDPRVTFPIGGTVELSAREASIRLQVLDH